MVQVGAAKRRASIFDRRPIQEFYSEIQRVYLSDSRPWVVGYSGGKDSTAALQMVWNAVAALPRESRKKDIYVISSDTWIENPSIADHLDSTLRHINDTAQRERLPIHAQKVEPVLTDSFWANLIGRGYAAPSTRFRWCTERLKIKPANRFILSRVAQFGEVVVVLGLRKSESATRAQVMSLSRIEGSILKTHSTLIGAYVYAPIEQFSVDDVWAFLLNTPCPWGSNNRDLLQLYSNAQAGECPLVIDTTTPSCGNSRFGCWACTLVEKDRAMEAMIDNGEEWLEPLLEFRDLLSETQRPEMKAKYRDYRRRNGHTYITPDGNLGRGPYKQKFRRELLEKLLATQEEVKRLSGNPNMTLIKDAELHEIVDRQR